MEQRNGFSDRTRSVGALLLITLIVAALVLIVLVNLESRVADVIAGGLVVSLKDAIKLFNRGTDHATM